MDLCHAVGVVHQFADLLFGCIGADPRAVLHITGGFSHSGEFALYFHLDLLDRDAALLRFTVDIVAVASRQRQEKQFTAVERRTAPAGFDG